MQIVKSLRKINNVNPIVFFKLFDARIQPILLYASEIWGFDNCQTVENVHVTAMKKFCDVSTRTPNAMLYGDCGRYPMYINAILRSVKYWCRLLRMEPSRYPVKVYRMMLNDIEKGYNWASKLRNILLENGMSDVWRAQKIGNEISFMRELKEALVHTYEERWRTQLNSDRFRLYTQIKNVRELETYLVTIDKKIFRDVFTKFRMGVSDMYSHKYRFRDDFSSILCPSCREEEEEEIHFLFECPVYEDVRTKYLRARMISEENNYVSLFGSSDRETLHCVSMYLYYTFRRRTEAVELMKLDEDIFRDSQ